MLKGILNYFGISDDSDVNDFNSIDDRMESKEFKTKDNFDFDWDINIDEEADITWT